jgi:hypothetical protein
MMTDDQRRDDVKALAGTLPGASATGSKSGGTAGPGRPKTAMPGRLSMVGGWVCLLLAVLGDGAAGRASGPAEAATDGLGWRSVRGLGPLEGIRDVAVDPSGRFALADARGVLIGQATPGRAGQAGSVRRFSGVGPALRARFDGAGGVFAVGEQGLHHVDAAGRVRDRTPRVGQGARALVSLDVRDGWLAVGGLAGVLVTRLDEPEARDAAARPWQRVHAGLAAGPVSDLAIGPRSTSGSTALWIVADGELHRVWLDRAEGGGVSISPARRQRPPGRPIGDRVRRVRVSADGGVVHVLYARATARALGPRAGRGGAAPARWELAFPIMPPDAELTDVAVSGERVWLASTAGVLVGRAGAPAFARANAPAGARATHAITVSGDLVFAAAADELWWGEPAPSARRVRGSLDRMPRDPELTLVHRRAIERLRLEPRRVDRLWRGLGRRAWLPSVQLRGGIDYGRGRSRDYDESFSYGQLNRLNDRNSARSTDYDAGISLTWDFADLAYSPESVDLSREARQLIGLRDNVLDEINQLYFDRQRALRALSAFADWSDPEADALRLRALELAAGLDAWTGGWFSTEIELPPAARAAWSTPSSRSRAGARPAIPIVHPADPVPNHAGRENS